MNDKILIMLLLYNLYWRFQINPDENSNFDHFINFNIILTGTLFEIYDTYIKVRFIP